MVTAAKGAEKFYTQINNEARYESLEMAVEVDSKLQKAWLGHPHLHIVANLKDGFDAKIRDFNSKVLSILGKP